MSKVNLRLKISNLGLLRKHIQLITLHKIVKRTLEGGRREKVLNNGFRPLIIRNKENKI